MMHLFTVSGVCEHVPERFWALQHSIVSFFCVAEVQRDNKPK